MRSNATELRGTGLIIDSDSPSRATLVAQFESLGWDIRCASSAQEAINEAQRRPLDLVLTEIRLPRSTEIDLLGVIKLLAQGTPPPAIVVVTEYPSLAIATLVARKGAIACFSKPVTAATILGSIDEEGGSVTFGDHAVAPMSLHRAQWEYVCWVLRNCGFNRSEAARILGIGRRTLQRKLETPPPAR